MAKKKGADRKSLFAGVDIGGTKIHVVIATEKGKVIARSRRKTPGQLGFKGAIKSVVDALEDACKIAKCSKNNLRCVGVGAPSPINHKGIAINAPNLGWKNEPLISTLEKKLALPIVAGNDCDMGTFGESYFGVARKAHSAIGLFMGTGLGGGIVIENQLIRGAKHLSAELGHMTVVVDGEPCGCGKKGCLEAYASKRGISRTIRHAILCDEEKSLLEKLCKGNYHELRSGLLKRAYQANDALAKRALHRSADYLGIGIGNIITLLGPEVVVLGGGVIEALGKELLPRIKKSAKKHCFPISSFSNTQIKLAALGDDAVALGALAWAINQNKK